MPHRNLQPLSWHLVLVLAPFSRNRGAGMSAEAGEVAELGDTAPAQAETPTKKGATKKRKQAAAQAGREGIGGVGGTAAAPPLLDAQLPRPSANPPCHVALFSASQCTHFDVFPHPAPQPTRRSLRESKPTPKAAALEEGEDELEEEDPAVKASRALRRWRQRGLTSAGRSVGFRWRKGPCRPSHLCPPLVCTAPRRRRSRASPRQPQRRRPLRWMRTTATASA